MASSLCSPDPPRMRCFVGGRAGRRRGRSTGSSSRRWAPCSLANTPSASAWPLCVCCSQPFEQQAAVEAQTAGPSHRIPPNRRCPTSAPLLPQESARQAHAKRREAAEHAARASAKEELAAPLPQSGRPSLAREPGAASRRQSSAAAAAAGPWACLLPEEPGGAQSGCIYSVSGAVVAAVGLPSAQGKKVGRWRWRQRRVPRGRFLLHAARRPQV